MYYFHRGGREVANLRKKASKSEESAVCPHCGNLYNSLVACKQHIKNIHFKTEVFKCSYCSKNFSTKLSLKLHEDRHTGNKSYKCPYCPYVSYTGHAVNKHTEKNHPGVEKPYSRQSAMIADEIKTEIGLPEPAVVDIPISIMNNIENMSADALSVERIQFDADVPVGGFEDNNAKSVVQYFVLKQ